MKYWTKHYLKLNKKIYSVYKITEKVVTEEKTKIEKHSETIISARSVKSSQSYFERNCIKNEHVFCLLT